MKKRYDFFNLRYPLPVAEVCRFFKEKNGEFCDLPFILPYDCKTVKYEMANMIMFENTKYLKLTEESQVILQLLPKEKRFYWGVVNISSEKNITFLIWVNLNGDTQDIRNYFLKKKEFCLIKEGTDESFTVLWSA